MKERVSRRGWWVVLALAVAAHATVVFADMGTITITKCIIREKDEENEITFGFARAQLAVYFEAAATCSCGCQEPLYYNWGFGDNVWMEGASVQHVYGTAGAGDRSVSLYVKCPNTDGHNGCGASAYSGVSVVAISGIYVNYVGDNNRLCFNTHTSVLAVALPAGISDDAHNLIDWYLYIYEDANHNDHEIAKANNCAPDMTLPDADWPTHNAWWGAKTLYVSIDGSFVSGQEDELITGAASYIPDNRDIQTFYDGSDNAKQNPSADPSWPNWFYYWRQTTANYGTTYYDPNNQLGTIKYEGNQWHAYLGHGNNDAYTPPEGDNGNNKLEYIDHFAWVARHEGRHVTTSTNWWPNNHTGVGDADEGTGDWIPDNQEAALGGTQQNPINGGPFDPTKINTDGDATGRDDEDYTCNTQTAWTEGDADDEDWAHPGKQWE